MVKFWIFSSIAPIALAIAPTAFAQSAPNRCEIPVQVAGGATTQTCPNGAGASVIVGARSLSAIGQGQISAPADIALLEFRFGSREPAEPQPGLSIQDSRRAAEQALQPVVQALRNAGISDRNIELQTGAIQAPKLLVKLERPSKERIQELVQTVDRSLRSSQTLFLQSIGAGYAVNSCAPLERAARRLALQDARSQITTLAEDVDVQLGDLLSVTVLPLVGSPTSIGCGTKVGVPATLIPSPADESTLPYNPSDPPEVQVRSQVSVTYGIRSSSGRSQSTPSRPARSPKTP